VPAEPGTRVSNLEAALRRALAKGDAGDPTFRKRVYTAAANAMERSVNAAGGSTSSELIERRKALASAITALEAEITGQAPQLQDPQLEDPPLDDGHVPSRERDDATVTHKPSSEFPTHEDLNGPNTADFPSVAGERSTYGARSGRLRAEPVMSGAQMEPSGPQADVSPHHLSAQPRERRVHAEAGGKKPIRVKARPFATMLAVTVVLAAILAMVVWTWSTGVFQSAEERDTSVPNPPPRLESEDSAGGGTAPVLAAEGTAEEQAAAEGWITIFTPADPTALGLARGAEASIESAPFGDFARLVTPSPTAEVQIDVAIGTLIDLQGKSVQINIVARADDGNPTEMSVTCDFGPLGDCGRRRFNVNQSTSDYLLRVDLPEASGLSKGGLIKLRTDINDNERPLNLLAVRIREVPTR